MAEGPPGSRTQKIRFSWKTFFRKSVSIDELKKPPISLLLIPIFKKRLLLKNAFLWQRDPPGSGTQKIWFPWKIFFQKSVSIEVFKKPPISLLLIPIFKKDFCQKMHFYGMGSCRPAGLKKFDFLKKLFFKNRYQ